MNACPFSPAPRPLLRRPGSAAVLLLAAILLPLGGSAGAATQSSSPTSGDRGDPYAGLYLGLGWTGGDIGGGFDGRSFLAGGDIVVLLPEFDRGQGFVVEFLGRGGAGGLGLSYSRLAHDVQWQGAPGEAVFNAADMDLRIFLMHRRPLQLFGAAGFGFKWLAVRDSATRDYDVGDAKFTDLGWNLGAGLLLYPTHRLMLECGVTWQSIHYTAVTPAQGDGEWATIKGEVDGGVTSFRATLLYNFRTPE